MYTDTQKAPSNLVSDVTLQPRTYLRLLRRLFHCGIVPLPQKHDGGFHFLKTPKLTHCNAIFSLCLSVCLSVSPLFLSVFFLPPYPAIHLFIDSHFHSYIHLYLSICLSVYTPICLYIHPFHHLSLSLSYIYIYVIECVFSKLSTLLICGQTMCISRFPNSE